jgi:hypothetical protein
MSLTSNKKKEIINNLGKYRNNSDATIKDFVIFSQKLVNGLESLKNESNGVGNVDPIKVYELINNIAPTLSRALDGATEYYDSLSKYYVTALNDIADLKTEKNNE